MWQLLGATTKLGWAAVMMSLMGSIPPEGVAQMQTGIPPKTISVTSFFSGDAEHSNPRWAKINSDYHATSHLSTQQPPKGYEMKSEHQQARQAIQAAMTKALDILDHSCELDIPTIQARIAPIAYDALDAAIMQTQAVFVLQPGTQYGFALEEIWVPLALAIAKAKQAGDELQVALLTGLAKYDIYITVSTKTAFIVGDSSCSWVADPQHHHYFSATTVMLHELLHGMGIYSLVRASSTEAFMGRVSIFDAQITEHQGNLVTPVFQTDSDVDTKHGQHLAAKNLTVAGYQLYNPPSFNTGSSLSHFTDTDLLSAMASPAQCSFLVEEAELEALQLLGWNCSLQQHPHTWSRQHHTIDSNALVQPTGQAISTDNCTQESCQNAGLCVSYNWDKCVRCDSPYAWHSDTVGFLFLLLMLGLCGSFAVWVLLWNTDLSTTAPPLAQYTPINQHPAIRKQVNAVSSPHPTYQQASAYPQTVKELAYQHCNLGPI